MYPFTLEPHVLALSSARRSTLDAHVARRAALLRARSDARDARARAALARIAPGFDAGGLLVPVRRVVPAPTNEDLLDAVAEVKGERDAMAALVDGLERLDTGKS